MGPHGVQKKIKEETVFLKWILVNSICYVVYQLKAIKMGLLKDTKLNYRQIGLSGNFITRTTLTR